MVGGGGGGGRLASKGDVSVSAIVTVLEILISCRTWKLTELYSGISLVAISTVCITLTRMYRERPVAARKYRIGGVIDIRSF